MNIAAWSLKNNRVILAVVLIFVIVGIHTYLTMPRLEDAEVEVPVAQVTTYFPGAAPSMVEHLVTDPVEERLREMPEVDHVWSQSLSGASIVFVQLKDSYFKRDLDPVWQDLRTRVADAAHDLPKGVVGPYINDEFSDVYGVVLALRGDGYTFRELQDVAERTKNRLLAMESVGKVDIHGIQDERIFIEFSNARLAEFGLGPAQLAALLKTQNIVSPAGSTVVGPERVILEATGEFQSLEDIRAVTLRLPGRPGSIRLDDIAEVTRTTVDPPRTIVRFGGEPALVVAVAMADGHNVIDMGAEVMNEMTAIEARLPVGMGFDLISYQPRHVVRSVNEFMINLGESFIMVALVVLLFAGLRTGLIVGAVVPLIMLMCVSLLPLFGVQIHRTSIGTLVLALGILVDNSVVISENILVRLRAGQERTAAVTGAVSSLSKPLLLASLCTILGFLPIYLSEGGVGKFCESLFIVMAITLLCSWILAQTFIPVVSHRFLKIKESTQEYAGRLYRLYRTLLLWSLKHRAAFIVMVILALAGGLALLHSLPIQFFPPNDRELYMVELRMPYGTDIRTTEERAARLEHLLLEDSHVTSVGTFIGYPGPRWNFALTMTDFGAHYARLLVNLDEFDALPESMARARSILDEQFPDALYTLQELENGPPVGSPIQIRISHPDIDTLYSLRDEVAAVMEDVPGTRNVRDDWGEWSKKLVIDVDQDKAKRAGFTSRDVALSLQTLISGLPVTELREGDDIIPVVLRSREQFRDAGLLEGLNLYSFVDGHSVPLSQVATPELTWQPSNIARRNQQRTMTLKADIEGRYASEILTDIDAGINDLTADPAWPAECTISYGGEYEQSTKASRNVLKWLPLTLALITLILIFQFNSLRRPLIVWLTLPPMLTGIALGLFLTGQPFSFFATLGSIALIGIIVSNAIILIECIDRERDAGRPLEDAIVMAGHERIRPILMTAITTVVGMLPLFLAGGLWQPLAISMISGLLFSTLLTLILCPVLYALFFRADFGTYRWNPATINGGDDTER